MHLTVIVISRNASARLRLALVSYEHALEQARAIGIHTEIVVVNDGSTDDTAQVLEHAAIRLPLRAIHNASSLGIVGARNRGAAVARGSLLLFMDGDVLLAPGCIAAHAQRHLEYGRPTMVRGPCWHLRCTRSLLDPQTGSPFPGQEAAVARMGATLAEHLVTAAQVRDDFEAIVGRARPGIYVGAAHQALHAAEIETLEQDGGRDVCWMAAPGHNLSMPKADFFAVGGYDGRQMPVEHRELALRLSERGLNLLLAPGAVTHHLVHQGQGRDPLQGRQDWMVAFYGKHSSLAAKLMLVFWHSVAGSKAIPETVRIDSILTLAALLRNGATREHERVFQRLYEAATH